MFSCCEDLAFSVYPYVYRDSPRFAQNVSLQAVFLVYVTPNMLFEPTIKSFQSLLRRSEISDFKAP